MIKGWAFSCYHSEMLFNFFKYKSWSVLRTNTSYSLTTFQFITRIYEFDIEISTNHIFYICLNIIHKISSAKYVARLE